MIISANAFKIPSNFVNTVSSDLCSTMRAPLRQPNILAEKFISLINNCISLTQINQIEAQLIIHSLSKHTKIAHHFILACQSLNHLNTAYILYSKTHKPHVFICNTLIKALAHTQFSQKAVNFYAQMNKNGIFPNNYTFPFVLKALADLGDLKNGQSLHAHVVKLGHIDDLYVGNSLMNLYASGRDMGLCRLVFDEMPERDVVSWTVMIDGYKEAGEFENALAVFEKMQYSGFDPNRVTMVNALGVCARCGALEMGIWIHDYVKRKGWVIDVILGSALVDMYAKCGRIEQGLVVFENMRDKDIYTWNTLIKGLALAKSASEAIRLFFKMEFDGVKPDKVTLIGVLSACSHNGLVQIGKQIFSPLIVGKYGFPPNKKHYACMVDLCARSGYLEEALHIIKEMPFEPSISMWSALLSGCRAHGNLELGEFCAWRAIELEPENGAYYAVLSNAYALMDRWSDVETVRSLMKERGLNKDLGCSSVDFQAQGHTHELIE